MKLFQEASPDEGFLSIKDESFDAVYGSIDGIIGWNGVVKSTLLNIFLWITVRIEEMIMLHERVEIRDRLKQYIELISETNISIG